MQFTAKWKGPPPAAQNEQILFLDCDTNLPTSDGPSTLNVTVNQLWIAASFLAPDMVHIGVNQTSMGVGTYSGTVTVKIPDAETCQVGSVKEIPVEMIVKKGQVKFA